MGKSLREAFLTIVTLPAGKRWERVECPLLKLYALCFPVWQEIVM
jgi:hypothetical protein